MTIPPELVLAAIPAFAAWLLMVDRKVASHEIVIQKMDALIDLLLSDRLRQKP